MTHASLTVSNDELMSVREAKRDLRKVIDRLMAGELAQVVLMDRTEMVAVIRPIACRGHIAEPLNEGLGGIELRDAAVAVLERETEPMHYRELAAAIEEATGKRIGGARGSATLLANLAREPRITMIGSRSGRYLLAEGSDA